MEKPIKMGLPHSQRNESVLLGIRDILHVLPAYWCGLGA
jgi:hypothetical protein